MTKPSTPSEWESLHAFFGLIWILSWFLAIWVRGYRFELLLNGFFFLALAASVKDIIED